MSHEQPHGHSYYGGYDQNYDPGTYSRGFAQHRQAPALKHTPQLSNSSSRRRTTDMDQASEYMPRSSRPRHERPHIVTAPSPPPILPSAQPEYEPRAPRPARKARPPTSERRQRPTYHDYVPQAVNPPEDLNPPDHAVRCSAPKSTRKTTHRHRIPRTSKPDYAAQQPVFEPASRSAGHDYVTSSGHNVQRASKPDYIPHSLSSESDYISSHPYDSSSHYDPPAKHTRQPSYDSSTFSSFSTPVQHSRPAPNPSQSFSPQTTGSLATYGGAKVSTHDDYLSTHEDYASKHDDYVLTHDDYVSAHDDYDPAYDSAYDNSNHKLLQEDNWDHKPDMIRSHSLRDYEPESFNAATNTLDGFRRVDAQCARSARDEMSRRSPSEADDYPYYNYNSTMAPYHATTAPHHAKVADENSDLSSHDDSDRISRHSDRISRSASAHSDVCSERSEETNSDYADEQSVSQDDDVVSQSAGDDSDYMSAPEDQDVISVAGGSDVGAVGDMRDVMDDGFTGGGASLGAAYVDDGVPLHGHVDVRGGGYAGGGFADDGFARASNADVYVDDGSTDGSTDDSSDVGNDADDDYDYYDDDD